MAKKYKVVVFGKQDCDKCKTLNKRLDDLLAKDEWAEFDKHYVDVLTPDGLVAFSNAECVNPQRIPAFMVMRPDEASGRDMPVPNPKLGSDCEVCGGTRLYQHLGLQTDYSEEGRGVITPRMIEAVLADARERRAG